MNFSSQKLIFVTGKGGVGKSACAAAIAWREARRGRKVCLVELGSQSFYEPFFETRGIVYDPIEVLADVHVALFNPEECIKEYVLHYLKVSKLYDLFFHNRVMRAFINAAPGLAEIAILGKLTSDIRGIIQSDYDLFVVDCFSTGHALALLRAPRGLAQTVRTGPIHTQSAEIDKVLQNPEHTQYVIVTLPEDMPVTESRDLYEKIATEFGAQAHVVCGKLLTPPLTEEERQRLASESNDVGLKRFVDYLKIKQALQRNQLSRIRQFSPQFFGVPWVLGTLKGQDAVEFIAKHLEQPWTLIDS
jgi:anion-transporting  ArsA/GET3 family ATPase